MGRIDMFLHLVCFCVIASNFAEVFGMRRFHQSESTAPTRAESDCISGCSGASESSTIGARDNASGGVVVYGGEARSEALLAMKECEKSRADLGSCRGRLRILTGKSRDLRSPSALGG
jgi:hypothetical protein